MTTRARSPASRISPAHPAQVVVEVSAGQRRSRAIGSSSARSRRWRRRRRRMSEASGRARRGVQRPRRGAEGRRDRGGRRRAVRPGGPGGRRLGAALGGGQESLQVAQPIAPVAARIDPVVAQPAGVAPGADRVGVDAEQAGGLGDGQRRVDGPWRKLGRHRADGGTVKSTVLRLPSSQFLPIGRRSRPGRRRAPARHVLRRPRSSGSPRSARRPPVIRMYTEVRTIATRPRGRRRDRRQRVADEARSLPAAARVAGRWPRTGPGEAAASRPGQRAEHGPGQPDRERQEADRAMTATAATNGRRGPPSARTASPRRARGWTGSAAGPARRVTVGRAASAPSRRDAERRSRARPTRPVRPAGGAACPAIVPAGTRSGASRRSRPTRAGRRRGRSSSAGWSIAIASRPSRSSKSTASACSSNVVQPVPARTLDPGAPQDERAMGSSSNSSSASIAAADRDVARPDRRRARRASATRHDRRRCQQPADPVARAERAQDQRRRRRARQGPGRSGAGESRPR